jgi:hypothetical protein
VGLCLSHRRRSLIHSLIPLTWLLTSSGLNLHTLVLFPDLSKP